CANTGSVSRGERSGGIVTLVILRRLRVRLMQGVDTGADVLQRCIGLLDQPQGDRAIADQEPVAVAQYQTLEQTVTLSGLEHHIGLLFMHGAQDMPFEAFAPDGGGIDDMAAGAQGGGEPVQIFLPVSEQLVARLGQQVIAEQQPSLEFWNIVADKQGEACPRSEERRVGNACRCRWASRG